MPLQNRLRPDGEIVAHPSRTGTLMGNRGGKLHDDQKRLGKRRWTSKSWIACKIAFRERRRIVMGPGYTELFALDEATMLAAGHRPCHECRRADFRLFAAAWARAHNLADPPRAKTMDAIMHVERLDRPRPEVDPARLPDGAVIRSGDRFMLVLGARALPWSFEGYGPPEPPPPCATLLTPPSVVGVLIAGYAPALHPSAADPQSRV